MINPDPKLYNGITSLKLSGLTQASGALLWTGRHIITAAHFTENISDINFSYIK